MEPEHIRAAIVALRKNIRRSYGFSADLNLIDVSIKNKLVSKQLDEIDAQFSTMSPADLALAEDINAEIANTEAASEAEPH